MMGKCTRLAVENGMRQTGSLIRCGAPRHRRSTHGLRWLDGALRKAVPQLMAGEDSSGAEIRRRNSRTNTARSALTAEHVRVELYLTASGKAGQCRG